MPNARRCRDLAVLKGGLTFLSAISYHASSALEAAASTCRCGLSMRTKWEWFGSSGCCVMPFSCTASFVIRCHICKCARCRRTVPRTTCQQLRATWLRTSMNALLAELPTSESALVTAKSSAAVSVVELDGRRDNRCCACGNGSFARLHPLNRSCALFGRRVFRARQWQPTASPRCMGSPSPAALHR